MELLEPRLLLSGESLIGDANRDEIVDDQDIGLIKQQWNISAAPDTLNADLNGDGYVGIEDMNTAYFEHANRVGLPRIAAEKAVGGFEEIHAGFEPEMLARETERCFSCGVCNYCDNCWIFCPDVAIKRLEDEYEVDYDYCKGCLVCVVECPRNCISTREEGK